NVQNVLQSINDVIVKNMPTWTKKVAEVMASFMQAGIYIVQALGQVWNWLQKLLQYVPGWAKGIAAALAIFSISNPFMMFMEAIGGAILLLDDFETYLQDPTKSALPGLWAWVIKVTNAIKQMGIGADIANAIRQSFEWLDNTFKIVGKDALNLFDVFKKNGTIKDFAGAVKSLWTALTDVAKALGNVITGIGHLFGLFNNSTGQSNMQNFFQLIADLCIGAIKIVAGAIEEIGSLVNLVGDALHGDWKAAGQVIQNMWTGQNLANAGIISQSSVAGAMGPTVGPPSYPYMFQGSSTTSTKNVTVNAPLTNNISSSSPQAAAKAVTNSYNMHMHTLKSVVQ
ncbi:hypothetical protein, partial [Alicyclobacillus suci]|uniref:hypothetical protein n=1 Tax=Alicyclobacillus suci TaxID=2816080 RepID=UPI001A8CEEDC